MADKIFDILSGNTAPAGFKLQSPQPLDARAVVPSVEDLPRLVNEAGAYEGMRVYACDAKAVFVLTDVDTNVWIRLDGTNVVDTITERNALTALAGSHEGMQVYVKEEKTLYVLTDVGNNAWVPVAGGLNDVTYTSYPDA